MRKLSQKRTVAAAVVFILFIFQPPVFAQSDPPREDTVLLELTRPLEEKADFNWFMPGVKINGLYPARREQGAIQAMWEPLLQLNLETGQLEPWLATELTPDPTQTVWTLKLRDDVTWSDADPSAPKTPGEPAARYRFTSKDVVFTANMVLQNLDLTVYDAARFRAQVDHVSAVDEQTVTFTLKKPNPRFAIENFGGTAFGSLLIMPEHIWKGQTAATFKFDKPIGTGPYILNEYSKDKVTFSRDDGWWGAKSGMTLPDNSDVKLPEPLELVWQRVETETESLQLLKDNELDAAREFTLEAFNDATTPDPVTKKSSIIGWTDGSQPAWNTPCARQVDINTQPEMITDNVTMTKEPNPWSSVALRKALSLVVDRQKVVDAYGGTTTPSKSMFVEYGSMAPFIDALTVLSSSADVPKADQLIVAQGYVKGADNIYAKDGKPLTAKIAVNENVPTDVEGAKALKQQFLDAGIKADIDPQTNEQYWGWTVPKGNYQLAYGWLSCGSIAEPYTSMRRYTNDPTLPEADRRFNNTGRWGTAAATAYKTIVDEMAVLPLADPADQAKPNPKLIERMLAAYRELDDEVPFIPLVQTPRILPFNTKYWTGWPTKSEPSNPAHDWGAMHIVLQKLKKAAP
ncbi:ABC transporter substrate-binding protein [Rhizobium leguminosarum]|uniref:ABC transporter substrate-binding protein n=1 Tax=Rhizobium leguminosarum TaxID=384 RepID=UPI001C975A76|nr:ABC transporter substrate-binding protein [Rhizobium leguminosarum]MBY5625930.1 ABC transporter substrate-binding protein [Rhizobium leguminosarum]